jgi:hypothetical protein
MIPPTVGRVVWLYGAYGTNIDYRQPFAASVAYVHDERLINVAYVDHIGGSHQLTSIALLQDDDLKPEGQPFACWMAAKPEALEKGVPQ